ncbi:hypothetical protein V1L54_11185 [Streptomyces sp. TRM 70361]|uniref:hypothetical protein n=1 Tax=Streptomyces sp. TRM 70361 TaxID=3116553 RepID=UPI002E7C2391|nr:hypothetical protein [Streptomyces sp. TRM 70361]MEE1939964.1 hypothetical protein [Streptomyces sp. TRM 70361]
MSEHGQLANTGTGALVVGGLTLYNGWWLASAALGLVAVGVLVTRIGFRAGRRAGER